MIEEIKAFFQQIEDEDNMIDFLEEEYGEDLTVSDIDSMCHAHFIHTGRKLNKTEIYENIEYRF